MGPRIDRLEVLQGLLRAPLQITSVQSRGFQEKQVIEDEVIVTHRLLMLRSGRMDYTVDGVMRRMTGGDQFFVPAWSRREWRIPARSGGCALLWCEFSSGTTMVPTGLCWRRPSAVSREVSAVQEMGRLVLEKERASALRLEGELKAALARFWVEARVEGGETGEARATHPEVARAVAWLERHYAEADALEVFYQTVELSPNHFRLLFKRETGETVQAVLARLRLRRARYLVQETTLPMKRIAAETGFADPLYFSGQYRKFWGRSATEDRRPGGVA